MVTHVLFDFDGTLVNTIDRIIEVVDDIIQKQNPSLRINEKIKGLPSLSDGTGHQLIVVFLFTSADYIPNLTSFQNLITLVNSELSLSLDPDENAVFIGREARNNIELLPGVEKLVAHLHAHSIPMAVATGAGHLNYNHGAANFPEFFGKYIHHAVCAFDDPEVKNRKPAPDCYIVAANRFSPPQTDMSKVLIFEDSITGLKGATASGGQTVFVSKWKSMFSEENQPFIEKAKLVIGTLEEFKPELFGLPPYES